MAEEKSGLEIDDWLDDLAEDTSSGPGQEASGELDQSDIDSLLGGTAAAKGAPPERESDGELDQSDIDALLGGGFAAPVSATGGGEGFAELDQSDIDSLLGGGEGPAVAAASGADDDFALDQSDLDDLFAGAGKEKQADEPAMAEGLTAPSKDDLDHLFSEIGDEEADRPETVGFAEVASGESGKAEAAGSGEDNFGLPDDGGFDDDEFDFGDLPDIPDETNTVAAAPAGGLGEEDIFSMASSEAVPDFLTEATMDAPREKRSVSGPDQPFAPPAKTGKKKGLAIAALCLMVLMGGGGYWYLTKNKKGEMPMPVPPPAQEKPVASGEGAPPVIPAAPVAPPNAPPVASESRWRMSKPNETLAIELAGSDENNDPLKFEIVTPPKFGRLSGDLPKITYLPNKDFPGEDGFEFRVSDGQLASAPAKVVVMGPEEAKPAVAAAEECPPPERAVVAAKNMHLKTMSTMPLTINWKKIWAAANPEPFDDKVSVEILGGAPLSGVLHRLDRSRHRYEPDRYFGGKEEVRYRFKAAGVYSKAGKLIITVKRNDKPPALLLRPVADSYKVGESVVLDAGLTRDDSPGGVRYSWEQLAGPPVLLEKRHGQESAVSFVVPSFFGGEQKTRLVIRVTATDPGGQRASKEIAITPVSKRQSALWGIPE